MTYIEDPFYMWRNAFILHTSSIFFRKVFSFGEDIYFALLWKQQGTIANPDQDLIAIRMAIYELRNCIFHCKAKTIYAKRKKKLFY